ncbi:MAG: hypothetical protein V3V08_16105 [Nannocystaceae bacterium]
MTVHAAPSLIRIWELQTSAIYQTAPLGHAATRNALAFDLRRAHPTLVAWSGVDLPVPAVALHDDLALRPVGAHSDTILLLGTRGAP